jgi:hypothetical protein
MRGLGNKYDVGLGVAPVDLNSGNGATGKRISMAGCSGIDVLVIAGAAASGSDDFGIEVLQHTAYTGGTSNDLDTAAVSTSSGITEYFVKSETLLDNDEAWTRVTQADSGEITLAGATYAAREIMVGFHVRASQLGTGYTHISVDLTYTTNAVRIGTVLYLPVGLRYAGRPDRLGFANLLRPGAANA